MSTVVLRNNVYNTPDRERDINGEYRPCIFIKNGMNTIDYLYPEKHGDILACIDGKICFTNNIADKVLIAVDNDGQYNPQSFDKAIAYGINNQYQLRPCRWFPENILLVTFCQGPFQYSTDLLIAETPISSSTPELLTSLDKASFDSRMNQIIASIDGIPVRDTIYLAVANLTFCTNGTWTSAITSTSTPIESHPIPFQPTSTNLGIISLQDMKSISSNNSIFTEGHYDYITTGYYYIINSVITTTFDNSPYQIHTTIDATGCTGYMICGQILYIPVSFTNTTNN